MDGSLAALQARLQHTFSDPRLLQLALTHRSFSADHNERLEFLGDSVLNLAVSHLLYQRLSALPEGDLSRVRANRVKQDTRHRLAVGLALQRGPEFRKKMQNAQKALQEFDLQFDSFIG